MVIPKLHSFISFNVTFVGVIVMLMSINFNVALSLSLGLSSKPPYDPLCPPLQPLFLTPYWLASPSPCYLSYHIIGQ